MGQRTVRVLVTRCQGITGDFALDPEVRRQDASGELLLTGWAVNSRFRVRNVQFGREDTPLASVAPVLERPRVSERHAGTPGAERAGFEIRLPTPGPGDYALWVTGDDGKIERLATIQLVAQQQPKLLFMHIAKAAGSTVNRYFAEHFARGEAVVHIESDERWHRAPGELQRYGFLSGHVGFHALQRRLDLGEFRLVTVVREPLAQLVSHLAWVRRLSDPGEERRLAQHPDFVQAFSRKLARCDLTSARAVKELVESLEDRERQLVDNCQVRYFGRISGDWVTAVDLDLAIRTTRRFDHIGWAEDLQAFLDEVAQAMGWPAVTLTRRENVTRDFYGLESAGMRVRRALRPLLRHDQELYEFIRRGQHRAGRRAGP